MTASSKEKQTHTPGPWRVNASLIEGPKMALVVATVACPDRIGYAPRDTSEFKANARLIAAAPEMLAALRAMRTVMDSGDRPAKLDAALSWLECDKKARAMCDAAIDKATGAQS